jgi:hypothetical protein
MKWLRQHQKSAGFIVTIAYGLLVLAAAPIGWFVVSDVNDKPLGLLIGLVISFAIGQLIIFAIAVLWFTDYHLLPRSSKRTTVEISSNPIEFAQRKCAVLRDLELQSINRTIYGVSYCNLFAKPEGNDNDEKNDVRELNSKFFRALADIVMRSDNRDVKLRILLHYDDEDIETNLVKELKARQEIFTKSAQALSQPAGWNSREHFEVKRGLVHSGIDYFVIQDHVFMTIRKTPGTRSTYIHIHGQELAKSFWFWLDELYDYGEGDGLVATKEIQNIFDRINLELKSKAFQANS